MLCRPGPLWLRAWAVLLLTPAFIWVLFSSQPAWAQTLAVCFVFAALLVELRRASTPPTGPLASATTAA